MRNVKMFHLAALILTALSLAGCLTWPFGESPQEPQYRRPRQYPQPSLSPQYPQPSQSPWTPPPKTPPVAAGPRNIDPVRELFHLVNRARVRAGVPLLRPAADLMRSARIRACELPRHFSHRRPDGRFFDTALRYRGKRWSENIAAGSETPQDVMDQWMHSPGHRQNMLDPRLREVGLGLCVVKDEYTHYWVQLFRRE